MTFDEREEARNQPQHMNVRLPEHNQRPGWSISEIHPNLFECCIFQKLFTADDLKALIRNLTDMFEQRMRMPVIEKVVEDKDISLPPQEMIYEFLKTHPCSSATYISRGLGIAKETVVAIVQEFIVRGQVEVAKKPIKYGYHAGRWGIRYKLKEESDGHFGDGASITENPDERGGRESGEDTKGKIEKEEFEQESV